MSPPAVSAIVLSGGRGRRMAERDKGLELLRGKPLVAWVAERVAPQADEVLLSANRNLERYREFGYPVLCDITPDFRGPLAGLYRVLDAAKFPLWLAVPCDTPFLPRDLVARLRAALLAENAEIAVAAAEDSIHPVICLGHAGLRRGLGEFLASGGRRVGEWQARLKRVVVSFDDPSLFQNINTLSDLDETAAGALE